MPKLNKNTMSDFYDGIVSKSKLAKKNVSSKNTVMEFYTNEYGEYNCHWYKGELVKIDVWKNHGLQEYYLEGVL